jgi:hypothetical protein
MRRAAAILTLLSVFVVAAGAGDAAYADNWGADAPEEGLDRDNNEQGRDGIGLTNAGQLACDWGAARLDNSEVNVHANDPSDIRCEDGYYGSVSWFGLTSCITRDNTLSRCDVFKIQFNLSTWGPIDNDYEREEYQYIGCHEFGHTSSLGHRPKSTPATCMADGSHQRFFDDHDLYGIDLDY